MSEALQHLSVPTNEEVSVKHPPEEMTDLQTPPPQPSPRVDLPAQQDSHPQPNTSVPEPTPLSAPDYERDFDRLDKMAYSWALALFPISVTLLLTNTQPVDHPGRVVLYAASTALAFISLVAVGCLSYYSIISQPSAQLAKVQVTVMGFSAVSLVLGVLSRLLLHMPFLFLMPFLLFLAVIASVIFSHRATASPNLFSTQIS